jgi:lysophospholipase L1-like esterase
VAAVVTTVVLVAGLFAAFPVGATAGAGGAGGAGAGAPAYDLAMGDSLAAGTGATSTDLDYVHLLFQHEQAHYPDLQLVNLACGGATTKTVLRGGGACSYTTGTQLGDAEAFLRSHPGQVAMVTIDIGANNVDGCLTASGIDTTCVEKGVTQVADQLPKILSGLTSAYPGLPVYGMDYYDPFLDQWLTGPSGQSLAEESEAYTVQFNSLLGQLYAAADAAMADPATLFQTDDFALTGTYLGATVPQNVAVICAWTLMCTGNGNIHTNDTGHAELALAFEAVVDQVTVTTTGLPSAVHGVAYSAGLTAVGGHPPYTWSLVGGALPAGLQLKPLSGKITGTPVSAGTSTFTVKVVDTKNEVPPATRHKATLTLSLTVN